MSASRFLLDTNIWIYAYKSRGGCRERIDAIDPQRISLCAVSLAELERGILMAARPQALREFVDDALARHAWAPFEARAARETAATRVALERIGQPIGPYDTLIAGIALANDLTLVTHNTREFERVPGLKLEDWYTEY
jgi:tRNA(fMet)-specific endonuclease VapC